MGVTAVPVVVAPVVVGVDAGVDGVVIGVEAGAGPTVGVSGACDGTGVVVSGVGDGVVVASVAWELAGVAVGAALGPGIIVETACGVPRRLGYRSRRTRDCCRVLSWCRVGTRQLSGSLGLP